MEWEPEASYKIQKAPIIETEKQPQYTYKAKTVIDKSVTPNVALLVPSSSTSNSFNALSITQKIICGIVA